MQTLNRLTEIQHSEVNAQNIQVSINSYGHLSIRFFGNKWEHCVHCGEGIVFNTDAKAYVHFIDGKWTRKCHPENPDSTTAELDKKEKDTLIVFDANETATLLRFVREWLVK